MMSYIHLLSYYSPRLYNSIFGYLNAHIRTVHILLPSFQAESSLQSSKHEPRPGRSRETSRCASADGTDEKEDWNRIRTLYTHRNSRTATGT